MSASLSSSLDMLSLSYVSSTRWASDSASDDEDEIVWSLSSSAVLSSSSPLISPLSETADYVLIPRMGTSAPNALATATSQEPPSLASALTPDGIAEDMAALSLSTVPSSQPRHDDEDDAQQPSTASATAPANNRGGASASAGPPSATATTQPAPTRRRKARTAHASSSSSSSSSSGSASAAVVAPLTRHPRPLPPPPSASSAAPDVPSAYDVLTSSLSSSSSSSVPKAKKSKFKSKAKANAKSKGPRAKKKGASESASSAVAPSAREREMGLGLRAVVDDSSLSEVSGEETSSAATASAASAAADGYHEAQKFMTSYLAHPPPPGNNGSALLMLQALILELGCLPNGGGAGSTSRSKFSIPELPGTLRQAKLLLKSRAFINVRDYLAVREQGQAALRSVMHSSRKSLVREVRKGKRVPVHEVKKAGLKVLLVNTHF